MSITLYTFKPSLWAGAPRLAIHELNIDNVNQVEINLAQAENFSPEYLKINSKHTVPALKTQDDKYLQDTRSVVDYLDQITGHTLTIPGKTQEIDGFLKRLHEEGDVGNPLFFTSGSQQELEVKKALVVPFLEGRIQGWEKYLEEAPEHADLYQKHIAETKGLLSVYLSLSGPEQMFAINKHLWEAGVKVLDEAETLLENNDYLFDTYSIADIHFTPYLVRLLLVRPPALVFENRPNLKAYYDRIQARPSFKNTFQ